MNDPVSPRPEGALALRGETADAAMNDDQFALGQFTGAARLFPLPNLVLFPHVVQPFRTARAKLLADGPPPPLAEAKRLRGDLAGRVLPRFATAGPAREQLGELFAGELPLGALCDILNFALPLPVEQKQQQLEETD